MRRLLASSSVALGLASGIVGLVCVAGAAPRGRPDVLSPPGARTDAGDAAVRAPVPCGRDGGLDCPLQAWMKVNAGPPSKTGDIELLAQAFDQIAGFAPHPSAYPNWASIARDGANVARRGRVDAARVACVSCHEQYRARFRQQMLARDGEAPRPLRELSVDQLNDAGATEGGTP